MGGSILRVSKFKLILATFEAGDSRGGKAVEDELGVPVVNYLWLRCKCRIFLREVTCIVSSSLVVAVCERSLCLSYRMLT